MNWKRAKSIMIVLFVFVDLLLLSFFVSSMLTNRKAEQEFTKNIKDILAGSNVTINIDKIPDITEYCYDIVRLPENEQRCAGVFLGDVIVTDVGGNIQSYKSEMGVAHFRSGGVFDISLNAPLLITDAIEQAKNWSIAMGVLQNDELADITVSEQNILVYTYWRGFPIWRSFIEFTLIDGKVTNISGRWFDGQPYKVSETKCKSAISALLIVSQHVKDSEEENVEVVNISLGFKGETYQNVIRMTPCWKIELKSSVHYVDAMTNQLETNEDDSFH